jgi:GNAT superfamily N-acetyltransferase
VESVILPITELSADELQPLLDESLSEGYRFVQTLLDEYLLGTNRFDTPGAALLGVYVQAQMIAIGGVHQDPYLQRADVGRVRHVYVLNDYRRHGVGKLLLDALVEQARSHFTLLTLRTNMQAAAAFYEAIGFSSEPHVLNATHWLELSPRQ